MPHTERMHRFEQTDLYVVITESFCGGRNALDILDACLDAGVRLVQFREKELDGLALYEKARAFRTRTLDAGALLIIDDRLDIALAVGADGVHLGQQDLPASVVRGIGPDIIIGLSTHNLDQALAAQENGASYVNIGPIFATQTKEVACGALGPEAIAHIAPHLSIPFTCMGGIKQDNIAKVLEHGARHVAVVTAVTQVEDPRAAASQLRKEIVAARSATAH